jgi:hypothetical protein
MDTVLWIHHDDSGIVLAMILDDQYSSESVPDGHKTVSTVLCIYHNDTGILDDQYSSESVPDGHKTVSIILWQYNDDTGVVLAMILYELLILNDTNWYQDC